MQYSGHWLSVYHTQLLATSRRRLIGSRAPVMIGTRADIAHSQIAFRKTTHDIHFHSPHPVKTPLRPLSAGISRGSHMRARACEVQIWSRHTL
jgi:hypothetical protein